MGVPGHRQFWSVSRCWYFVVTIYLAEIFGRVVTFYHALTRILHSPVCYLCCREATVEVVNAVGTAVGTTRVATVLVEHRR